MIKKIIWHFLIALSGEDFIKEYKEIITLKNKKDLQMFEEIKLKRLLLHAYKKTAYYKKIFDQIGLIKNNKIDLTKFGQIPILTKDMIRNKQEKLKRKDISNFWSFENSSGGSTGEPLKIWQDKNYRRWSNASRLYYFNKLLGIDEESIKKVLLWGSERDLLKGSIGYKKKITNFLLNTTILNTFKVPPKKMRDYIAFINKTKPDFIRGYAGSLYEIANFAQSHNLKIHTPKILVSAAETLKDFMRKKIESVFKTKVYNFYGSREVGVIAGECKKGLMHCLSFNNKIEIIKKDGEAAGPGEEGDIIVTNLHNYAMPLVRYKIEDIAIATNKTCECDSFLPTFKKVIGRSSENLFRRDGTMVSGSAMTLTFNNRSWVKNFQIIQKNYEQIKILIALAGKPNRKDMEFINNKTKLLLGENCQIEWEFVKNIPKTKTGKYVYIKNEIKTR